MADEIEARAAATKPLLGKFIMQGQATMIYAEPNAGKTLTALKLCLDAIEDKRIAPDHLYYINADDSSEGLAIKLRLVQEVGAHMLAPGFNGFRTDHLVKLMVEAIENGSARGTCIVIDTLKKFTDLMDKKRASEFAQVCRQYVMAGGTIVALGHTTKRPRADGTPEYQGTTDILEDFDAVYVAQPFESKKDAHRRVVKFTRRKSRADSPEAIAYAYNTEPGISYDMKIMSLHPIDPDDLDDYAPRREEVCDPEVMQALVQLIGDAGWADGKMKLAKAAAETCGLSMRATLGVVERYTGLVPGEHLWACKTGPRGVRIYRLIDQTRPAT
jgi:RecA-family ATPase